VPHTLRPLVLHSWERYPFLIWTRNLSTSDLRVSDWRDNSCEAVRICPADWPVSEAACVTPVIFEETSWVPVAA